MRKLGFGGKGKKGIASIRLEFSGRTDIFHVIRFFKAFVVEQIAIYLISIFWYFFSFLPRTNYGTIKLVSVIIYTQEVYDNVQCHPDRV